MEQFFKTYSSNTLGASANQLWFAPEQGEQKREGVVFYQLFAGGTYHYSMMFSNIMDSTFFDGALSRCNMTCPVWTIHEAYVSVCDAPNTDEISGEQQVTFNGNAFWTAEPGSYITTDPVKLHAEQGQYLAVHLVYSGTRIPYYEEIILSCFARVGGKWEKDHHMPVPCFVGCDRPVARRIGYLGDSITAGEGTEVDSYAHWNACLSRLLGSENGYWNMGIGYGRASDAASGGFWMQKAETNEICLLNLGVNDIFHDSSAEQLFSDLQTIINRLLQKGVRVLVQTVPPGDYSANSVKLTAVWEKVNESIRALPQSENLLVFDNHPILCDPDRPEHPIYGLHPMAEGCAIWAKAIYDTCRNWILK